MSKFNTMNVGKLHTNPSNIGNSAVLRTVDLKNEACVAQTVACLNTTRMLWRSRPIPQTRSLAYPALMDTSL